MSRNESSVARRKHLRMICKTQVGHKIHVRIDWSTFFLNPEPPWARNRGSKICLERASARFASKMRAMDGGFQDLQNDSASRPGHPMHF